MSRSKITLLLLALLLVVLGAAVYIFSDELMAFKGNNAADAGEIVGNPLIVGDPNAKVTLQDFSSLTCPHCKVFKEEIYPVLMEKYVDSGQLKIISYDFPLDQLALVAATLPRCVEAKDRHKILAGLYRAQSSWASPDNPLEKLAKVAEFQGFTKESFDQCINNDNLLRTIIEERSLGEKLGVRGTPTLFINGKVLKNYSLGVVEKAIQNALNK